MVVMGEELPTRPFFSLFGLICQLFGYSHNTVALPPKRARGRPSESHSEFAVHSRKIYFYETAAAIV